MTDFPTLSCTSTSEITSLSYTRSLKKVPLFGRASLYRPLCLVPTQFRQYFQISSLLQIFEKGSRAMITLGEMFTLKDSSTRYLLACTSKFCSDLFFSLTICATPSFARGCKMCISRDTDTLNGLIFFHRISPEDQTVLTWFQRYSHE